MRPSSTTLLLLLLLLAVATAAFSPSSLTGHGLPPPPHRGANSTSTVGCFAHEREALLAFKRGITHDPPGLLASWQPGGQQDCCRWRGVRCSNWTGHVVVLDLRNQHGNQTYSNWCDDTALIGEISPSLLSLQHLQYLDLSMNLLQGPTRRVPEFLGSLRNLRYLNLSGIPFSGRMPPQLGNLSKLHFLDLSGSGPSRLHYLVGVSGSGLHSTDISVLTHLPLRCLKLSYANLSAVADWAHQVNMIPSLRVLDLSGCDLPSANQSLPHLNLTNLEELDLSENYFNHPVASCWFWKLTNLRYLRVALTNLHGQFPDALGRMTSLKALDFYSSDPIIMTTNMRNLCNLEILNLGFSDMNGNITELFERLPQCSPNKLKELHLSNNNLTGVLPNWIEQWAALRILDLSVNQLIGPVPSEIGMLNNLTLLYLGDNNLRGVITHEHFADLKSLTEIDMSSNSLKIMVDQEWLPPFRLQSANFASCEMGPKFPTWLQSQVDVEFLDISSASIFDRLPDWFCTTFSNAWKLNISNNGINGTLPKNMEIMTSLERLNLNSNQLTGQIPRSLPKGLEILDMSRNNLSGSLPSNFVAPLNDLRLFSNQLTGHIPESLCGMQNMGVLDLADNLFEGEFPKCFPPASFLSILIASNNRLSGKIPSLQRCTYLAVLDLEQNNFSGELPMWIGDLVDLEIVRLGYNNLSGSIPETITNLTKLLHLDLAANSISGVLPWHLSKLRGMRTGSSPTIPGSYFPVINLSVSTKGHQRYYEERQIFHMVVIDLSSNFLTGGIPEEITSLDGVISLNLSRNHLSGIIPRKIGVMQSLESLDLSENKLYGEIPQSLSNLTYLSNLDLSYNNLTGRIPSGGQLSTLYSQNPFMFDGNSGLCGYPLHRNCSNSTEPKHSDDKRDKHDPELMSFPFGLGIGYIVGLWLVFCVMLFVKSWRIAYFCLVDKVYDKVYVLLVVTWASWAQKTPSHE